MRDQLVQLNDAAFLLMNATGDSPALLVGLAVLAAKLLVLLVPLDLLFRWLVAGAPDSRRIATASLLALLLALAASQVIGAAFYTPRPFLSGMGHTLMEHRPSASFPSNHGIVFATHAAVLWLFGRRAVAMAFALLGLVVAWARIYLGVHFPVDMLGSVLIACAAATAACLASRRTA